MSKKASAKDSTKTSAKRYSAIPRKASAETRSKATSQVTDAITTQADDANASSQTATLTAEKPTIEAKARPTLSPLTAAEIAAMFDALRSLDADTASEAATSLGRHSDSTSVDALINVIENTDGYFHGAVRAAAAASLGQLGDTRAFQPLLNAVRDPMAEASAESVRALASLGDPRAIGSLIEVIRNADGFYASIVRRAAVLALGELGGAQAIAELRSVASNDAEDSTIRQTAASLLSGSIA
jgi:HEAT repeat protein